MLYFKVFPMVDIEQIKRRWQYAWEAKRDELDRIEKASWWMFEFERHLERGEEGDGIYRFPETMGYVLRRYNNFLEILPEARVQQSGDSGLGMQASLSHFQTTGNFTRTRMKSILHASAFGSGGIKIAPVRNVKYNRKTNDYYTRFRGIGAEFVGWRWLFPAPGFSSIHDHTGEDECPYLFRLKTYHTDTFRQKYSDPKYKNVDKVMSTTWGNPNIWQDSVFRTKHETEEITSQKDFISVLEYWDQQNDIFAEIATGGIEIYDSKEGIEYSHKTIPYHQYRNIQRTDTINGLGEIELNLPYNLFREKTLNLGIMDMMLQLQPAVITSGDIDFNTDENELEPGAVFNVKGLNGGKLADNIMPFSFGSQGLTQGVFTLTQLIENSRIAVTSDDTTALYSNPNQLATQTLAKMQTLNKSIDTSTKQNIYDTEFYIARQMMSLIKNELAAPIKENKKVVYPFVKIKGYKAVQEKPDKGVKFVKEQGAISKFRLNKEVTSGYDPDEIEIISVQKDEELKRDRTEKLMMLTSTIMQTLTGLANSQPQMIREVFGTMDIPEFIKTMAKNLGLDEEVQDIFPVTEKEDYQLDEVNAEHEQIMSGVVPPIREDEDSLAEYSQHLAFMNSAFFKKHATKKVKDAMKEHLNLTLNNAYQQNSTPISNREENNRFSEKTSYGRSNRSSVDVGESTNTISRPETFTSSGERDSAQSLPKNNRKVQQELISG